MKFMPVYHRMRVWRDKCERKIKVYKFSHFVFIKFFVSFSFKQFLFTTIMTKTTLTVPLVVVVSYHIKLPHILYSVASLKGLNQMQI